MWYADVHNQRSLRCNVLNSEPSFVCQRDDDGSEWCNRYQIGKLQKAPSRNETE